MVDRILIPLSRRAPWLAEPDRALLDPLPADVAVGYAIAALRHGTHGTVDDYRAFGGEWGFDLQDVHAPVRGWRGTDDTLLPASDTRRVVDALPRATMHEVPAAGHFLFATHTAEVSGALLGDAGA